MGIDGEEDAFLSSDIFFLLVRGLVGSTEEFLGLVLMSSDEVLDSLVDSSDEVLDLLVDWSDPELDLPFFDSVLRITAICLNLFSRSCNFR